jgi:hypothetical protein
VLFAGKTCRAPKMAVCLSVHPNEAFFVASTPDPCPLICSMQDGQCRSAVILLSSLVTGRGDLSQSLSNGAAPPPQIQSDCKLETRLISLSGWAWLHSSLSPYPKLTTAKGPSPHTVRSQHTQIQLALD